jgi:two-component system sensor histidine kinase/response regulator
MAKVERAVEQKERILVIDDEVGIRSGCQRALTPHGYLVEVAATGQEGLAKLREDGFALVLLDVMMPDVSGIDLLEPILAHDPDVVCVVITGFATVELAVQAIKLGAYDFISKPFTADTLSLAVEKGLERRQLQKEARRLRQIEKQARRLSQEKAMLEELDRVKSTFMLTVAHELRAPIAAIASYLTLILQGYAALEEQWPMLERAAQRTDELLDLVDDLLNLARLKELKADSKKQEVSLEEILEDVLGLHTPETEAKQIILKVDAHPCTPIEANPAHMKQLWTNLISNAIKYTPAGGQITVRLFPEGGGTVVGEVEDTGIGIAAEDLPNLFKEFFRTDQAKALAQHGTGLGLSIVKQIVNSLGGSISVESELGQGTKFTFRLPAASSTSSTL